MTTPSFLDQDMIEDSPEYSISSPKMKFSRISLRFTNETADLEEDYVQNYNKESLSFMRFGLLLGCCFVALFAILDYMSAYEVKNKLWAVRFFVMIPVGLIVFGLSYVEKLKQWVQLLVALFALVAGLSIVYMTIIAPSPANYSYYAGLMLVTMFIYAITKLRFIYASLTSWTIFIVYNLSAIFIADTPVIILISNNFFFFSANLIGMIMGYLIELSNRKNYFLSQLNDRRHELELEATKLRIANRLAATVAHEFNTPLCVIENIYDLAELDNVTEETFKKQFKKIPSQVAKMKVLVDKLLTLREIRDLDYAAGMKILDIHSK